MIKIIWNLLFFLLFSSISYSCFVGTYYSPQLLGGSLPEGLVSRHVSILSFLAKENCVDFDSKSPCFDWSLRTGKSYLKRNFSSNEGLSANWGDKIDEEGIDYVQSLHEDVSFEISNAFKVVNGYKPITLNGHKLLCKVGSAHPIKIYSNRKVDLLHGPTPVSLIEDTEFVSYAYDKSRVIVNREGYYLKIRENGYHLGSIDQQDFFKKVHNAYMPSFIKNKIIAWKSIKLPSSSQEHLVSELAYNTTAYATYCLKKEKPIISIYDFVKGKWQTSSIEIDKQFLKNTRYIRGMIQVIFGKPREFLVVCAFPGEAYGGQSMKFAENKSCISKYVKKDEVYCLAQNKDDEQINGIEYIPSLDSFVVQKTGKYFLMDTNLEKEIFIGNYDQPYNTEAGRPYDIFYHREFSHVTTKTLDSVSYLGKVFSSYERSKRFLIKEPYALDALNNAKKYAEEFSLYSGPQHSPAYIERAIYEGEQVLNLLKQKSKNRFYVLWAVTQRKRRPVTNIFKQVYEIVAFYKGKREREKQNIRKS